MATYRRISFAAIPLLFLAGQAAAATSINFTVKGNTVTALFDEIDPADSCYQNFVFIAAADGMQKLSPGGSPVADVQVSLSLARTYLCNPEGPIPIISGQGVDALALLQVVGNLSSATLIATVPFFNDPTSDVDFVQINLTFRATDKPEKTKSKETFSDKEGGLKVKATSDSTQAPGGHRDHCRVRLQLHADGFGLGDHPEGERRLALRAEEVVVRRHTRMGPRSTLRTGKLFSANLTAGLDLTQARSRGAR